MSAAVALEFNMLTATWEAGCPVTGRLNHNFGSCNIKSPKELWCILWSTKWHSGTNPSFSPAKGNWLCFSNSLPWVAGSDLHQMNKPEFPVVPGIFWWLCNNVVNSVFCHNVQGILLFMYIHNLSGTQESTSAKAKNLSQAWIPSGRFFWIIPFTTQKGNPWFTWLVALTEIQNSPNTYQDV